MIRLLPRYGPALLTAVAVISGCSTSGSGPAAGRPAAGSSPRPIEHRLVAAARWVPTAQGQRLRVTPTRYGRDHAAGAAGLALQQALAAAAPTPPSLPRTARAALTDQLRCHAAFAPRKPLWDLEAWRPDVGYLATVAHRCNP